MINNSSKVSMFYLSTYMSYDESFHYMYVCISTPLDHHILKSVLKNGDECNRHLVDLVTFHPEKSDFPPDFDTI